MAETELFIERAQRGERRSQKFKNFTSSTTNAAIIMLICAVVAIIVANSPAGDSFVEFWETEVGFIIGSTEYCMSLAEIINDIFMAVFFLLVGLDVKREITVGELKSIRTAILPVMAAVGGVMMPAIIYTIINIGSPETANGWAVPTATDIAFALGIMSLLGNRVPSGVRVFLTTRAVADDIIAIVIIALFYGESPSLVWLAAVVVVMVVLMILNRRGVYSLTPYILLGVVLWFCVFMSGIHCTIAGVLLAFTIPTGSRVNMKEFMKWSRDEMKTANEHYDENEPISAQDEYLEKVEHVARITREVVPPATRLEHTLFPWVYFFILPLFALTNADVSFTGASFSELIQSPALLGVFFGLLLGKPIGIVGMSFILVKLKVAQLPPNVTWTHMVGAGILGGVGFTMAIFVANLAYTDASVIATAKLGILCASACAGIIGYVFLSIEAKRDQKKGLVYVSVSDDIDASPADSKLAEERKRMLEEMDSTLVEQEIEAALKEGNTSVEVVADLGASTARGAMVGEIGKPEPWYDPDDPEGQDK